MHDDELFLRTIRDLGERINSGSQYDWLRASGLVRQLLIDGQPLVDRVNREHRLKLAFEVPDATGMVDEHTMVFIAADDLGVIPRHSVDRKGLLATRLIFLNGQWRTVHDIVDTVANALGGVHKGEPKGQSQSELSNLNASLHLLGGGAAVHQMRRIGQIVIVGLKPLVEAVARKHGIEFAWASSHDNKPK